MRKKVAIIIGDEVIARNYIRTETFKDILEKYNCTIFVNNAAMNDEQKNELLKVKTYVTYKISKILQKTSRLMNDANMYKKICKSKSFSYRIERKLKTRERKDHTKYGSILNRINLLVYRLAAKYVGNTNILHGGVRKILKALISNEKLYRVLNDTEYEAIIVPTVGSQPELDITGYIQAKNNRNDKQKMKTIWLFDNWDNLSSKTVNTFKPYACSVWGEQTKLHAMSIQGYQEDQIWKLGTPRFEVYYGENDNLKGQIEQKKEEKYILFCGVALDYDEDRVLKKIVEYVKKQEKNIKILYRPHPWGERYQEAIKTKHDALVEIDESVKQKSAEGGLYDVQRYFDLIKNAYFIIGGSTSMLIEAALMKKKYLLLAHKEYGGRSPFESLVGYEHIGIATGLSNITTCYDIDRLEEAIKSSESKHINDNDTLLEYILTSECRRYRQNLNNMLATLLQ